MGFFEHWERQQQAQVSLIEILKTKGPQQVSATAEGFQFQNAPAVMSEVHTSIRCFGAELTAKQLCDVLALLPSQSLLMRMFQPHPELSPALVLDVSQPLSAPIIQALRDLSSDW